VKKNTYSLLHSRFRITLCVFALLISLCPMAFAQSAGLAAGSATGSVGTTVTIPVDFAPGSSSVSTMQFDLLFGSSFAYSFTSTGSAASAAGKDASANIIPGGVRVLIYGLNQNTIPAGPVANIQLAILAGAPVGSSPVAISAIVACDPDAVAVAVSGTSGSITTQGAIDTTPPVISQVGSSGVTASAAAITWTTNEAADSQVQYGTTASYGSGTSVNSALTGSHSQNLSGLSPATLYHYRVMSRDAAGNLAVSGDYTIVTPSADRNFVLTLPRFFAGTGADAPLTNGDSDENLIGMALTNLGTVPASFTFTAMDSSGNPIEGPGIVNPKTSTLGSREQIGVLDSGIFGDAFVASPTSGWIRLETDSPDLRGFFLAFDARLNFMDGGNIGTSPMTDFAFTEVQQEGATRISIANANPEEATVTFSLMNSAGIPRSVQLRVINGNGALVADLYNDLFSGLAPDPADYVLIHSTRGVVPFELMQKGAGDISSLAAQDTSAGETTLYSPQYVVGGPWQTSLSVINLDTRAGLVTLRLMGEDGVQIGVSRTMSIPALGKLQISDPEFFTSPAPGNVVARYVEIVSDGVRLAGSTVFGDATGQAFDSALALISNLQSSVLFSHIASNDTYFTGLAILNPNAVDATATIEIYAADGQMIDSRQEPISARQRSSRLLTEYFPSLVGKDQSSGYIRIISDVPVASFALFGTNDLSVLSAIPPQVP
jgi:hypothetical protein